MGPSTTTMTMTMMMEKMTREGRVCEMGLETKKPRMWRKSEDQGSKARRAFISTTTTTKMFEIIQSEKVRITVNCYCSFTTL